MVNPVGRESGFHPANSSSNEYEFYSKIEKLQVVICNFFIQLVNRRTGEEVIDEFEQIFIDLNCSKSEEVNQALNRIVIEQNQSLFSATLKQSFYILINNWTINQQQEYAQALFERMESANYQEQRISPSANLLRKWTRSFLQSKDYQEICRYALHSRSPWINRYQSYLLSTQIQRTQSPAQDQANRQLIEQLKDKYKFDLAMYVVRSQCPRSAGEELKTPTQLGPEASNLIKTTISTERDFIYARQAEIFLVTTQNCNYEEFKESLLNDFMLHVGSRYPASTMRDTLQRKLEKFHIQAHLKPLNKSLISKTCQQVIRLLTTENNRSPSFLFLLLVERGNHLTLAILLLKTVLISKSAQIYLESCIANLIQHYQNYDEEECGHFIQFLEVFNLVFTLFTANVEYHLVNLDSRSPAEKSDTELNTYRLFCQFKGPDLRQANLRALNLSGADLKGANLRQTDLRGMDLIQVDLRLANLMEANLSGAILNEARLLIANLNAADLSDASLIKADLRRADLQYTNLTQASLTSAKLAHANLKNANLNGANLMAASLNTADLNGANLSRTNFECANLKGANLTGANLSYSNLRGANLSGANLSGANLSYADLRETNFTEANLDGAYLRGANFYRATLRGSRLKRANLIKVNLSGSNLCGVDLEEANLSSTHLRYANFTGANLSEANLSHADLTRSNLTQANLSKANLSYTYIRHANLMQANLDSANLVGANLFGTDFQQVDVRGVTFEYCSGLPEAFNGISKPEELDGHDRSFTGQFVD